MVASSSIAMVLMAALALPGSGQSRAEVDKRYTPAFNRCISSGDAAKGVTAGIMDCTGAENMRQDARLNQTYRTVMARLNPAQKTALRALQRDWIVQRDAGCRDDADVENGGSAAAINYSSCILDQTILRTIWLERYRP
ncbi:hypothetical protein DMC47_14505 [Nostoc sp. 3335mG]|jgi:uncharacterized protein YecT (DUF1311 family)|nr:hypothetical protein DMC47_14505 [Nostoc sp. 3335mG]